jgi:hypothetical protein
MSSFPNFSNIDGYVVNEINRRKETPLSISELNCWARIISGVSGKATNGLVLVSNPNIPLFRAAGQNIESLYGSSQTSGTIGKDWNGKAVNTGTDPQIGLPSPVISSFEVDEGSGNISRKATFTITAYTKKQLEEVTKYFLEPGFTVFLEWGWNTTKGVAPLSESSNGIITKYVTKASSATELKTARQKSSGHYECYLGFITGGGIGFNGNAWEVTVNLTGFTELPSYLNVSDNTTKDACGNELKTDSFTTIENEKDLGKKRFKMMYNELPSVRRTNLIKDVFLLDPNIANPVNFVNFEEEVRSSIETNSKTLWGIGEFLGFSPDTNVQGKDFEIPSGLSVIGTERFIRFGTLMDILNKNGVVSIMVGENDVSMNINTKNTPISAFDRIFSTDKSKLIIPNDRTPRFSIIDAVNAGSVIAGDSVTPCSIKYGNKTIKFPYRTDIKDGMVEGIKLFYDNDGQYVKIDKKGDRWGFLDDLYVNFDFVSSIIDTPKLLMKEALYQILNGMSSAVNGLWNFQIIETPKADNKGILELRVVDLNFISNVSTTSSQTQSKILKFDLYGVNSVFMDSSFNMDIGGAMMNKIIGERLSATLNPSDQPTDGRLFARGYTDKVITDMKVECPPNPATESTKEGKDEIEARQKKNLEDFLQKVGVYPNVGITDKNIGLSEKSYGIDATTYFISYDDKNLFNQYKLLSDGGLGGDVSDITEEDVSILLPITFSFTIHGVSGIKRGDMFVVNGLPDMYNEDKGFFQVLSVKHTVENMIWKTTVEGGFRQKRKQK